LISFNGKGNYSTTEFTWNRTVGLAALGFLDSNKFAKQYEGNLIVGDFYNGNVYHFELKERTGLVLKNQLSDKVADTRGESKRLIFGLGLCEITLRSHKMEFS
jgi:hypothetical protein